MPIRRMTVIFSGLRSAAEALDTAQRALASAGAPQGLRFLMPKRIEQPLSEMLNTCEPSTKPQCAFYGERSGLKGAAALLTDETHFLSLTGAHGFAEKWDHLLYGRLAKTPEKNAVLTGVIGEADGELAVQAYLPAFLESFENDAVLIGKGLPLVCSAAPVRTLVVDPSLVFGTVDFLRTVELRRETLSIAAYVAGVPVYALDRAALWPLHPAPDRRLARPVKDVLPGTTLARFEQLAGLRYEEKRVTQRASWGLFTAADAYPQQLPSKLMLAQRAKALFSLAKPASMPLLVTAFIDLPSPCKPIAVYMLRFEYLKALENLPLYLYTGGAQERQLRLSFANARCYPDNALLLREYLAMGMTAEQWMQRNKILLLEKAAREHPDLTHVAWINADMLKHPICPQAAPDFSSMMDDRIHIATVNAIPDMSFVMVPTRCLGFLKRELIETTQLDVELKRSLTEVSLVQRLYQKRPDLFALHPMLKKHLLFFKAFDPSLLDARYQKLLGDSGRCGGRTQSGEQPKSCEAR